MLSKHGSILWTCLWPCGSGPDLAVCPLSLHFLEVTVASHWCCINAGCAIIDYCVFKSGGEARLQRNGSDFKMRGSGRFCCFILKFGSWKSGWKHPLSSLGGSVTCMFVTQWEKSIPLFKHELHHHRPVRPVLLLDIGITHSLPFFTCDIHFSIPTINKWYKSLILSCSSSDTEEHAHDFCVLITPQYHVIKEVISVGPWEDLLHL